MSESTNQVPLSLLREAVEYDCDTGEIRWLARPRNHFRSDKGQAVANTQYAGKVAGCERKDGYRLIRILGTNVYAHRVAFALHYGAWPNGLIDHIDQNPRNNRIYNLRDVSLTENMRNQRRHRSNRSGHTGVRRSATSGKWIAYIYSENQHLHLGTFDNKNTAILARQSAELELGYCAGHGK